MDNPSLKKTIIQRLALLAETESYKKSKITLITSMGLITGNIVTTTPKDSFAQKLYEQTSSFSSTYAKDFDAKTHLPGDDGYITLENVAISSPNNDTRVTYFKHLIVFFDQIIGVTIS